MAFLVDDVVEFGLDLVVHAAEVVPVETVPALLAQLFEQLTQALQLLAVAIAQALLHHPAQGGIDVAVVEELVGQLVEGRISVEFEALLRAVPPRIREPGSGSRPTGGPTKR